MSAKVSPIPEGFHTVSPHMVIRNASAAIDFYKKAFGAEEIMRMTDPSGQGIIHAEIKIGNSMIMIVDEMPDMKICVSPEQLGGTTIGMTIYCEDTDAMFKRAIEMFAEFVSAIPTEYPVFKSGDRRNRCTAGGSRSPPRHRRGEYRQSFWTRRAACSPASAD